MALQDKDCKYMELWDPVEAHYFLKENPVQKCSAAIAVTSGIWVGEKVGIQWLETFNRIQSSIQVLRV